MLDLNVFFESIQKIIYNFGEYEYHIWSFGNKVFKHAAYVRRLFCFYFFPALLVRTTRNFKKKFMENTEEKKHDK